MKKILNQASADFLHGGPATAGGTKEAQSERAWLLAAGEKFAADQLAS